MTFSSFLLTILTRGLSRTAEPQETVWQQRLLLIAHNYEENSHAEGQEKCFPTKNRQVQKALPDCLWQIWQQHRNWEGSNISLCFPAAFWKRRIVEKRYSDNSFQIWSTFISSSYMYSLVLRTKLEKMLGKELINTSICKENFWKIGISINQLFSSGQKSHRNCQYLSPDVCHKTNWLENYTLSLVLVWYVKFSILHFLFSFRWKLERLSIGCTEVIILFRTADSEPQLMFSCFTCSICVKVVSQKTSLPLKKARSIGGNRGSGLTRPLVNPPPPHACHPPSTTTRC